jgi:WD40 repeat protein
LIEGLQLIGASRPSRLRFVDFGNTSLPLTKRDWRGLAMWMVMGRSFCLWAPVAALTSALLLVGCGGGDSASDASTAEGNSTRSAAANGAERDDSASLRKVERRTERRFVRKGVVALALARDGSNVGVATADGRVRLLDATSTAEKRTAFAGHNNAAVMGVLFSGDGQRMVSVGRDSVAHVWDISSGKRMVTLRGHEGPIRALASSDDGAHVATGGEGSRVLLWDGGTAKLKKALVGSADFVNALAFSPDGKLVVGGSADSRVIVWNVATGRVLQTLQGHKDEINAVTFSPDGKWLVSAGEDGRVLMWDVALGRVVKSLDGHAAAVRALAFSSDSSTLASGDESGKILVWHMGTRQAVRSLTRGGAALNTLAFLPGSAAVLYAGDEDSQVVAWQVDRGQMRQ